MGSSFLPLVVTIYIVGIRGVKHERRGCERVRTQSRTSTAVVPLGLHKREPEE
jgi:hypothetical protein